MQAYQKDFIKLALEKGALKFGSFVLKSGRVSPYFFNAGAFNTGSDLEKLGQCYAQALNNSGITFDVLFGPAYKGIPLACATAMAMSGMYGRNIPWCFNRKEKKDHGEGGNIVGSELKGDVLLIDDVITAGTAIRESAEIIKSCGANFKAALISLDRQEKGKQDIGAIEEVEKTIGIKVISIISFSDLLEFIKDDSALSANLEAMVAYRQQYGI
ncbi:MAG: orotate phosphoribosyltransferase [Succinivibrio sp.]|nr:orotate phosphoribosyltransferase [Succinivibrio sp.]